MSDNDRESEKDKSEKDKEKTGRETEKQEEQKQEKKRATHVTQMVLKRLHLPNTRTGQSNEFDLGAGLKLRTVRCFE